MINRSTLQLGSVAIAILLLSAALTLAVPPQRRTVHKLSHPGEPVEIIAIKAKGKAIKFGKPFPGKNDWPGGLSFVIKNTSTRSVSWVRVSLTFWKQKGGERMADYVTYGIGRWDIDKIRGGGPPLKPGETAEVFYPVDQYQGARELMDGMGYPRSMAQIRVSADQVIFEDQPELMWIEGTMNEFQSPTGWKPVRP